MQRCRRFQRSSAWKDATKTNRQADALWQDITRPRGIVIWALMAHRMSWIPRMRRMASSFMNRTKLVYFFSNFKWLLVICSNKIYCEKRKSLRSVLLTSIKRMLTFKFIIMFLNLKMFLIGHFVAVSLTFTDLKLSPFPFPQCCAVIIFNDFCFKFLVWRNHLKFNDVWNWFVMFYMAYR